MTSWTDQRIARELEAWCAHHAFDTWPTYRTFVRDGHKRLHAELTRAGGPARWAPELGLQLIAHRPGRHTLSDQDVAEQLRALLREHRPARFPNQAWIKSQGPPGLSAAVKRTGGATSWARRLNMPTPQPARWTDELIASELRRVCATATSWPTPQHFHDIGADALLRAVYNSKGSRWWAQQLGLPATGTRAARRPRPNVKPTDTNAIIPTSESPPHT